MEAPQISGKVFRFLSTMHPSLSKAERKKYSDYDPERWYPWTADIAGEFTDLMRRSPRDTSFARGLAYTAQKGLPEDAKMTAAELVRGLPTLPAAYNDGGGTGFQVQVEGSGSANVAYSGMPGFTNACIAIAGELVQRLQAIGARGLEVKHAAGCRLQGADACNFEVHWSADAGEGAVRSSQPAAAASAARPQAQPQPAPSPSNDRVESARPQAAQPASRQAEPARAPASARSSEASPSPAAEAPRPQAPPPSNAPRASAADAMATGGSAQELFDQLRSRLLDAEQQSTRHADLEQRIADLEAEVETVRQQAAADVDEARADANEAVEALVALKRQIRSLVGDN